MSEMRKRYCIYGCDSLVTYGVPSHRFPHPEKNPELFDSWLSVVGDKIKESDRMNIYKNKRICDYHFHPSTKISGRRLNKSAIPSVYLHQVRQSCTTFIELDHCYSPPKREFFQPAPLMDITNLPEPSRLAVDSLEIPIPSGSVETTCVVASDKSLCRMPHTKYDAEKTFEFLKHKTQKDCSRKIQRKNNEIRRLRQKLKTFKVRLWHLQKETRDTNFAKLSRNVSASAKLFTRMQYMEGQKKKKGHRFTLEEKVLSLSFYKKSPKTYSLMCKHFTLPSRKILKSMLAQVKLSPGINKIIFDELKSTVSKMRPRDRLCTLIFDEMSISPQILYNSYTDDLVGFENFGDEKTIHFANHALVFMVKGVKRNFKQPVAYFFTQRLSTPRLKNILKEVVTNVQTSGLKIVATVCDQGSPNPSCINDLVLEEKHQYFNAGKEWRNDKIIINDQEITPLFDVPHLLKGIRNNLLTKDMTYTDNNITKTIKWEYFQNIFIADESHGELKLLPRLTREHVDPNKIKKMRVKNAAQVLSHSMAVAADNLVARGDVPSECRDIIPFIILIDNLFDSLNATGFVVPCGKKYRAAVRRYSPHHGLWQEAIQTMKSVKFLAKRGDGSNHVKHLPTINNFIKTVEGFKSLLQLLSKKYCLDAMFTRNFNQDPLENFFGSIRSLGARNVLPNCMGFEGAFKTLLLNNFSSDHAINANCEEDANYCLQSFTFMLKGRGKNDAPSQSQDIVIDQPLDIMETDAAADSGADQRFYVCGWALTKSLKKIVKGCNQCKSQLLGNSKNQKYRYIQAKEFEKGKEWLCYPSDCLVACFEDIQKTTIAFLNSEVYKPNIKERIVAFVDLFVDFSFMNCVLHKDKLKEYFLSTTIKIIIYSWCRSVNRILDGKINYDGEDIVKQAAQRYYNTHRSIKK